MRKTDLGASFMHKGKLWFVFGDSRPTGPEYNGGLNHFCGDAVAFAADPQGSTCPNLDFVTHPGTNIFRSPVVPGVNLGCFNVPTDGVSLNNTMYVWFSTDHFGHSLLSRSDDDGQTFTPVYTWSERYFINVSAEVVRLSSLSSSQRARMPPVQGVDLIMLFGSGPYRQSEIYLAALPARRIEEKTAIHYFTGTDPTTGRPLWSTHEADARPITTLNSPCVGELSVHFNETLKMWVRLFNCKDPDFRGINIQTARDPWGPWSTQQVIFNGWQDNGYCHFIHKACDPALNNCCDDLAPPGEEGKGGGTYGPYIIEPLTETDESTDHVSIYYVMSTWVPYNTVVIRTVLKKLRGRSAER